MLASTPETPGDLPILFPGVNDSVLSPTTRAIALGSNTAQAVAPVLKVLSETFGIDHADRAGERYVTAHAD